MRAARVKTSVEALENKLIKEKKEKKSKHLEIGIATQSKYRIKKSFLVTKVVKGALVGL